MDVCNEGLAEFVVSIKYALDPVKYCEADRLIAVIADHLTNNTANPLPVVREAEQHKQTIQ